MAKRKTLVAPSTEDLSRFEDEFRRETLGRSPLAAPIAHVAADTAAQIDPRPLVDRTVEAATVPMPPGCARPKSRAC